MRRKSGSLRPGTRIDKNGNTIWTHPDALEEERRFDAKMAAKANRSYPPHRPPDVYVPTAQDRKRAAENLAFRKQMGPLFMPGVSSGDTWLPRKKRVPPKTFAVNIMPSQRMAAKQRMAGNANVKEMLANGRTVSRIKKPKRTLHSRGLRDDLSPVNMQGLGKLIRSSMLNKKRRDDRYKHRLQNRSVRILGDPLMTQRIAQNRLNAIERQKAAKIARNRQQAKIRQNRAAARRRQAAARKNQPIDAALRQMRSNPVALNIFKKVIH